MASSYKKIAEVIFHNLELLAKEADPQDEKEQINASVMIIGIALSINFIENCQYLLTSLGSFKQLDQLIKESQRAFDLHMINYSNLALKQILHEKMIDFFAGIERNLKNGLSPEEIVFNSSFSKINARKIIASIGEKDIKEGFEYVHSRIEKHFAQPELRRVISAQITSHFDATCKSFQRLLNLVYSSDLSLNFGLHLKSSQ